MRNNNLTYVGFCMLIAGTGVGFQAGKGYEENHLRTVRAPGSTLDGTAAPNESFGIWHREKNPGTGGYDLILLDVNGKHSESCVFLGNGRLATHMKWGQNTSRQEYSVGDGGGWQETLELNGLQTPDPRFMQAYYRNHGTPDFAISGKIVQYAKNKGYYGLAETKTFYDEKGVPLHTVPAKGVQEDGKQVPSLLF